MVQLHTGAVTTPIGRSPFSERLFRPISQSRKTPLCGEGAMWPITRPGTVQKPDAVTVCNKGESYAKMMTVQDDPGATFSCLPMYLRMAWVCSTL